MKMKNENDKKNTLDTVNPSTEGGTLCRATGFVDVVTAPWILLSLVLFIVFMCSDVVFYSPTDCK
jgi:hypothetical protein